MLVADGVSLKTIASSSGSIGKLFSADLLTGGGGAYGVLRRMLPGDIFALPPPRDSHDHADWRRSTSPGQVGHVLPRSGPRRDRALRIAPWDRNRPQRQRLFVTDETTIRKVAPDGTVSTLAGRYGVAGSADGQGADARFTALRGSRWMPRAIYVVEEVGTVRRVVPNGLVKTVAGVAGLRGLADGQGTAARFNAPQGIAIDASGTSS